MAELVDAPDLGSGAARRGGSSPFTRTNKGVSNGSGNASWASGNFSCKDRSMALEEPDSQVTNASISANGQKRTNGMQVTQTLNEGLKREFQFVVPGTDLDERVEDRLVAERPNIQINGFRRGKVPISLVRKLYAKGLKDEIRETTVRETLESHFSESGERSATTPAIKFENKGEQDSEDLSFSVAYEAFPAIPDMDFKSINIERLVIAADEEEIQKGLENIARIQGTYHDTEAGTKAELGNLLVMDFKGLIDGEEFEEGSGEDFFVELGNDLIAPGFDEQLVGAEVGSTVEVKATFRDSHHNEELRGKEAVFSCLVKELKEMVPCEIDDELAVKVGREDLEDLRSAVKERFEASLRQDSRFLLRYRLLNRLDEVLDFELPPSLLEAEISSVARQLAMDEEQKGPDGEAPAAEDSQEDGGESDDSGDSAPPEVVAEAEEFEPTPEHIRIAERRLRLGLFFVHVGRLNNIQVNERDMEAAAERMAIQTGQATPAQYLEMLRRHKEFRSTVEQETFERKVVEFLFELVDITDREATAEELQEAIDAIED